MIPSAFFSEKDCRPGLLLSLYWQFFFYINFIYILALACLCDTSSSSFQSFFICVFPGLHFFMALDQRCRCFSYLLFTRNLGVHSAMYVVVFPHHVTCPAPFYLHDRDSIHNILNLYACQVRNDNKLYISILKIMSCFK